MDHQIVFWRMIEVRSKSWPKSLHICLCLTRLHSIFQGKLHFTKLNLALCDEVRWGIEIVCPKIISKSFFIISEAIGAIHSLFLHNSRMPQRIMHISDLFHVDEVNQLLVAGVLVLRQFAAQFQEKWFYTGKTQHFFGGVAYNHWVGVGRQRQVDKQQNMQTLRDTEIRRWLASIHRLSAVGLWIWMNMACLTCLLAHVSTSSPTFNATTPECCNASLLSDPFLKWIVKQDQTSNNLNDALHMNWNRPMLS